MEEVSEALLREIIFKPSIFSALFWLGILYLLVKIISEITKRFRKTR